ncbi:MAG: hypothetical protein PF488_04055, partial [Patescibacteria group bacterium]|nr:hypothetical protein [Patescibacteria group bacterium]
MKRKISVMNKRNNHNLFAIKGCLINIRFLLIPIITIGIFLLTNSPVLAIDGIMNGKKITGSTDNYLFWLQTLDESSSPYYTDRLFVGKDGNVGIGMASPGYKLDVAGTGYFADDLEIADGRSLKWTGASNDFERILLSGIDDGVKIGTNSGWGLRLRSGTTGTSGYLSFVNDATEAMRITDGNVGIGTTTPATKLHVVGGGEAIVRNDTMSLDDDYDLINKGYLDSAIPDIIAGATSSIDYLWTGSLTGDISNANSGNIGIGTETPSAG